MNQISKLIGTNRKAYACFFGYPRRGGQYLHYERYADTVKEARDAVAKEIRKARKA